jgi:hypothetical protein
VVQAASGARHEASWAHGPLMRSWERGELVRTETGVRLPTDFPAGPAQVTLQMQPRDQGQRGPLMTVTLGAVTIPDRDRTTRKGFTIVDDHEMTDSLVLESHELRDGPGSSTPAVSARGAPYSAHLAWRAAGRPTRDLAAVLTLSGNHGRFSSAPHTVGGWFMLPPAWQAGDRFRQEIRLRIPDELAEGRYDVLLHLHQGDPTWAGIAPQSAFALGAKGRPVAEYPLGTVLVAP